MIRTTPWSAWSIRSKSSVSIMMSISRLCESLWSLSGLKLTSRFPVPRSGGFGYRPPHLTNRPMIKKITSSAATFAALSSLGDVFTFSLPNPLEDIAKDIKERHVNVKPQLIWGLRKKFTAAQVSLAVYKQGVC
jgi:hypothetical protein